MAIICTEQGILLGSSMLLNDVADIAERGAGFDDRNGLVEAFLGHHGKFMSMGSYLTDIEHLARIPVKAVLDDRDINIHDVTFFQDGVIAGYAMTDDMVHGCADRLGKTIVIQRGRDGLLLIDYVVMTNAVEFTGADARYYVRTNHFQHFGCKTACHTHFCNVFGAFYGYWHWEVWR